MPVANIPAKTQTTTANITNARAAEIIIAPNNVDVYVSNRLTHFEPVAGDEDSIIHYQIVPGTTDSSSSAVGSCDTDKSISTNITLKTLEETPSGGINPRFISLGSDGRVLYVGNVNAGPAGLVAYARSTDSGIIDGTPIGTVDYAFFGVGPGWGPQFIQQVA
jgi:6-phosphogluconolactonase (cycloisomerase 2 family)